MSAEWKAGDGAYFDPSLVVGGKGFSFLGILVPIADLPKRIKVMVISVKGDEAIIAIDGGRKDGATGRAYTKNLAPFLG
jgi:hypothetical protein